jgi:hypothetical protein
MTSPSRLSVSSTLSSREIRTGALNTVQAGQVIFIESTAEGREGHFYDLCEQAQSKQRMGTPLTSLDFKFHFFPWQRCPDYQIDPTGVVIDEPLRKYFDGLGQTAGIVLTPGQKAWYAKKSETQLADMRREYPSTPEEAFEASIEGAYFADQLAAAEFQGRIGEHTLLPEVPVNTSWDIGMGDYTSIWFFQQMRGRIGLVGYYQNCGEGMPHYVEHLKDFRRRTGCTYGTHVLPHDIWVREWGSSRTRLEQFIYSDLDPGSMLALRPGSPRTTRSMLRVRRWAFVGLMRLRVATDLRRCAAIAGSGTRRRASGAISLDTIKLRMEQTHSKP